MQWFFFKNGMFFKKRSFTLGLKQDASRLLIPFAYFSLIGLIFFWLDLLITQDDNIDNYTYFIRQVFSSGFIAANPPLWFLLSLFIVRIVYTLIQEKINDYILIIISVLLAFICYKYSIVTPRYLANSAIGMAFFVLGKQIKILQYDRIVLWVSIVVCLLISFFYPSRIAVIGNEVLSGFYLLSFPYALSGIIIINAIAKRIPDIIYKTPIAKFILMLGRESMFFLVMHWIIITFSHCIVVHIFLYSEFGLEFLISSLVGCFIILPILFLFIHKYSFYTKIIGLEIKN